MLHSLSRKLLNVGFVKAEEITNILYQTPSIPKLKTSIIRLVYNINQGKGKRNSHKNFLLLCFLFWFGCASLINCVWKEEQYYKCPPTWLRRQRMKLIYLNCSISQRYFRQKLYTDGIFVYLMWIIKGKS